MPWRRRQQEKQEMEQALRTEQRLREEEKQQHRQQLEHERQIRAMMELEQNKKEAEARQRALAENDKKSKALADRHRREELEAQRKREIELKRMATSPEALQHLRELVRQRYELDMEIWQLRDVRKPDRPEVERRMYRADALLKEIQDIVKSWKMDAEVWTEGEGKVALEIRDRLLEDGKRIWRRQPPWAS